MPYPPIETVRDRHARHRRWELHLLGDLWQPSRHARPVGPGIPGILIHGHTDLGSPVITAWELAQAWPGAELVVVEDSGHTGNAAMEQALEAAADQLFTTMTRRGPTR